LLLLFFVSALYLLQSAISDEAWVAAPVAAATPEQVFKAKSLAKRTLRLFSQQRSGIIAVEQTELDSLSALLGRAYPQLRTQLNILPGGLQLTMSVELPSNPLGRYLSWQLVFPIAPHQLRIEQLQLGGSSIPDPLLKAALPWLLDSLFGQEQRQILLQTLRLDSTRTEHLSVLIQPPLNASQRVRELLARIQSFSGDRVDIDPAQISRQYSLLQQQAEQFDPKQWVSITQFIAPVFRQLDQQPDPEQAQRDGSAAILALAIYLGSGQIEQLTGPVLTPEQRQQPPHHRTLLSGRIDLRQHFLVSAALQVLAEAGFSHAIGEFKELLDSRRGGSGFSFPDLAADRAGTLFALQISHDPQQAVAFLKRFEEPLRETDLMIPIDTLPEGLSQAEFQERYQDLNSDAYKQLLEWIDTELAKLRLYR
tara:strand:+ start:6348 stop:7616 length:1269 start_codon:yes stop_codon:yes gene_type:complete